GITGVICITSPPRSPPRIGPHRRTLTHLATLELEGLSVTRSMQFPSLLPLYDHDTIGSSLPVIGPSGAIMLSSARQHKRHVCERVALRYFLPYRQRSLPSCL